MLHGRALGGGSSGWRKKNEKKDEQQREGASGGGGGGGGVHAVAAICWPTRKLDTDKFTARGQIQKVPIQRCGIAEGKRSYIG